MLEKRSDEELITALASVFRTYGYEGASMARISAATGLQKSSLYYRFPGGKQQMAQAVAAAIADGMYSQVLAPLRGTGSPRARVKKSIDRLSAFYAGGGTPCILETLSLGDAEQASVAGTLNQALDALIAAFSTISEEAGIKPNVARDRAVRAVVLIEGALVLSRVRNDRSVFEDVMRELPGLLCDP